MKALGYSERGPIAATGSVVEFTKDDPQPKSGDLLVEVCGVSVNPVDVKVRANRPPPENEPRILGFDAAGVVREVGTEVTGLQPGDEVFYAGEFTRDGSNAQLQTVDQRLVGKKPSSLSFADAAGLPLTSITAWEMLFDSFGISEGEGSGDAILIIGGAGGVGSIMIQLAKKLTALTVIATASRSDTVDWVKKMGADLVVNHHEPLNEEVKALGIAPKYVAALTGTEGHWDAIIEMIEPRGHIGMIDDPTKINWQSLKMKALSFSWEFMFARSMFGTKDMDAQSKLLSRVSAMIDSGHLISTVNRNNGPLTVDNLREALAHQESGAAVGKTVLEGMS
ncbi:MAG: zinc-binding alcohol dehydrogenase family protein [Aestuariivita sp.]|nr:zinc-binding alcohol dehydrogenase family protein [Aestuariivita sp.]MCY4203800.1 zinc-binding alcohol dehydrogenase family protein [Aestuariivita sp.]MCY4288415.1 zinc-binding alcohol dehydrogenase family protein [Aestuariivita sp.]MCY4345898.1 zinc-binding alcohol dehydrogenase family protein [Aestuariivita sp.]